MTGGKFMECYFGYEKEYLKNINGLNTAREIYQQPELWSQTLDIMKANKKDLDQYLAQIIEKEGLRVIFTGAGTSAYVGESVVPTLRKNNNISIEAIATTDIVAKPLQYLKKEIPTLLISCARSGNSPESVAAVEIAEKVIDEFYHIVITCNSDGELAKRSRLKDNEYLLLMPKLSNDKGFAMTGSFSCMLLASMMIFEKNMEDVERQVQEVSSIGKGICEDNYRNLDEMMDKKVEKVVYLGAGGYLGLARESCLKLLELTGGNLATLYETPLGFRHGPKSIVDDNTIVFSYISGDDYSRNYEIDLLRELSGDEGNKFVVAISQDKDDNLESFADRVIDLGIQKNSIKEGYDMLAYILYAQIFALKQSINRGFGPDNPCPSGEVNRVVQGVTIHEFNVK
jgi:tagatose-6-phosphate ketose/aldose isomerase